MPIDKLAASKAPVSLIFGHLTGLPPYLTTSIAIVATLNVVVLIIMTSRVVYVLAVVGQLRKAMAKAHPVTRTPVRATVIVTFAVLVLALWFPLGILAERATQAILLVFLLVNAALIQIKYRRDAPPPGTVVLPFLFPVLGLIGSFIMLVGPFILGN